MAELFRLKRDPRLRRALARGELDRRADRRRSCPACRRRSPPARSRSPMPPARPPIRRPPPRRSGDPLRRPRWPSRPSRTRPVERPAAPLRPSPAYEPRSQRRAPSIAGRPGSRRCGRRARRHLRAVARSARLRGTGATAAPSRSPRRALRCARRATIGRLNSRGRRRALRLSGFAWSLSGFARRTAGFALGASSFAGRPPAFPARPSPPRPRRDATLGRSRRGGRSRGLRRRGADDGRTAASPVAVDAPPEPGASLAGALPAAEAAPAHLLQTHRAQASRSRPRRRRSHGPGGGRASGRRRAGCGAAPAAEPGAAAWVCRAPSKKSRPARSQRRRSALERRLTARGDRRRTRRRRCRPTPGG